MNTKAMFEALLKIMDMIDSNPYLDINDIYAIRDTSQKALMTKPRNCDIGTIEERNHRFGLFCDKHDCLECPCLKGGIRCSILWNDMEYEGAIK